MTEGADLLEIARRTLLDEVVPGLEGEARFKALMVANAMAIVGRAWDAPEDWALDAGGIAAAIRAGRHDGDADLRASLLVLAEARCRVSAPKALAVSHPPPGPSPSGGEASPSPLPLREGPGEG